jgi:predicted ATP-grasp superfamily ATP-dependent carboligase/CelD/BcsL family acetyltransferase involved in cellulose biosynthesis
LVQVTQETDDVEKPPAVVVGLCTHGLAITRSLGRRGVKVYALESNPRLPGTRTRFVQFSRVPDINGPSLVEELVALAKKLPPRPVLFLTNDNMVRQVCKELPTILRHYRFNFPAPELVLKLLDKQQLAEWSIQRGFRYPRTCYVSSRGELESVINDLSYPVALKPSQPLSNFKARQANDAGELTEYFNRYFDGTTLLIQEWVPGTERSIYFCNYYFDQEGRPVAQFVGRKIRSFPRLTGGASSAEPSDRPELLPMGLRFFEGAQIRGPAAIEFKEGPDGTFFVIEPTIGRFDFYIHVCTLNGVDMPYLAYRAMADYPASLPEGTPDSNGRSTAWMDFELDFPVFVDSLFHAEELRSSLSFFFRKKGFALWAPDDLRPSLHAWPRSFLKYGRKLLQRLPGATPEASRVAAAGSSPFDVELVTSFAQLVKLKSEWESYSALEGNHSVFLTHDWFENFAHEILDDRTKLAIYVLRGDGVPGAIFPMMLERARISGVPTRRLKFLANFYSPIAKPLWGTTSFPERVALACHFFRHVRSQRPTRTVLDFSPVPGETGDLEVLKTALEQEGMLHTVYYSSANWFRPVERLTGADLDKVLPSRVKNTIHRHLARARREGVVEFKLYTAPEDIEARIHEYYDVYRRSWKRPEPYPGFHARLAVKLARTGEITLGIVYFNQKPVAAQLWLMHRQVASILKLCHDEAFKQYSFGTILTYWMMLYALDGVGVQEIDYLTGDEPYKKDWMSSRRDRYGILAFGGGIGSLLGATEVYLKPALKRIVSDRNVGVRVHVP